MFLPWESRGRGARWAAVCGVAQGRTRLKRLSSSSRVRSSTELYHLLVIVVWLLSCVWLFVAPWTGALQASLPFTISWSWLILKSIVLVMLSSHLFLCHPLLPPSVFTHLHQGLFQWVSSSYQMATVLELHLQHLSFQWIFRVNFL